MVVADCAVRLAVIVIVLVASAIAGLAPVARRTGVDVVGVATAEPRPCLEFGLGGYGRCLHRCRSECRRFGGGWA